MTDRFKNKYRIPSNRLRGWNYDRNGHYFITIVTANREMLFGNINNGEMQLNEIGRIVYDEFFKSFEMRHELFLGAFVLMPNHLHAIVILDRAMDDGLESTNGNANGLASASVSASASVETHGRASLQTNVTQINITQPNVTQSLHRQPKSISSFVAGFKSATVRSIDDWIDAKGLSMPKYNRNHPLWQANYHDHIIRNEHEYQNIAYYIETNPTKWNEDCLNNPSLSPLIDTPQE